MAKDRLWGLRFFGDLRVPAREGGEGQISSGEMVFGRAPVKPEREGAWP